MRIGLEIVARAGPVFIPWSSLAVRDSALVSTGDRLFTLPWTLSLFGIAGFAGGAVLRFGEEPLRVALALAAVALLGGALAPRLARRLGSGTRDRLLLALLVAALTVAAGRDLARFVRSDWVRVWNVFHYYLGAEYFGELGYNGLYRAALAADGEIAGRLRTIRRVRNLETYAIEDREDALSGYDPMAHFSPERWEAFKDDLRALEPQMSPRGWREVLVDRGYNPSPFWTAVASRLTHLLPAESLAALKALAALDLLLFGLTFWQLRRSFGVHAALLVALLFALSPVNAKRLAGGFLQYDWFCALACGLAWLKERRPVPAALALAYTTLARIFPLALVAAALVPPAWRWLRTGRVERFALRFGLAFVLCLTVGFGIGCTTPRGIAAWGEFRARLTHHAELHTYGEQRLGLKHIFTRDFEAADWSPSNRERQENLARQEGLYRGAAVVFLALLALALLRRSPRDGLLLGLVAVFVLTVASRYYWATLALLPLAAAPGRAGARRAGWLALAQAALYLMVSATSLGERDPYTVYALFNLGLAALLLGWLLLHLGRDLAVFRRCRRRRSA